MRILVLVRRKWPEIGGVQKHVYEVGKILRAKGGRVKVISEKDIKYPKIKFIGIVYIWLWFLKNIDLIKQSEIVHCHDVFIWYLPFRFLFPKKKVFTTFHGWEGKYPIPQKNIVLKKLAARLSDGTIAVGKYIEKWYKVKADLIIYGAVDSDAKFKISKVKSKRSLVFIGRLELDTGISKLFDFLNTHKSYMVDFCGDGSLRQKCEIYGRVHGFIDPKPFLKQSEICFAGGYLSALEGLSYNCKLMVGWDNPVKRDYWKLSPFWEWKNLKKLPTWGELTNLYIKLWQQ